MIELSSCVICEGMFRTLKRARVALFLAKRIWKRSPFCVGLVKCDIRGFMFYKPRPEERELPEYSNYRIAHRVAQMGIKVLARPSLAGHVVRPVSLYMMQEHVNYFTQHCLAKIVSVCGARVPGCGSYTLHARAGNENVGWCLGSEK